MMARRRVPLRYQLTKTECAAACLAMVLSHYGRHTTVPACRDLLGAGRDGASAAALAEAAEQSGLDVDVDTRADPFQDRLDGVAVAFLSSHHFVVVAGASRRHVTIVDPSSGRQTLSRTEFAQRYGNVLLRLRPGPRFEPKRARLRDDPMLRYLWQFVAAPGGRRLLALTVVLAAALQIIGLGVPLLTKFVVDTMVPANRADLLPACAAGVLLFAALSGGLSAARAAALLTLRGRADRLLTAAFVGHLFRLPMSFFLDRARGDLLLRLASVSTTREALTQQLLTTFLDGALLTAYLIGLVLLSPLYALLITPLFAAQMTVLAVTYRRLRTLTQHELALKAEEQNYLVEALEAVAPLKANGVQDRAVRRWAGLFDRYQAAMLRRGWTTAWLGGLQRGVGTLGPLLLLVAGAWMVLSGRMSLGAMLAANAVALSVLAPMETFASFGQMYHSVRAQVERLFDVVDTQAEPSGPVRLPAGSPARVELDEVTFHYQARQEPVLAGVSVDLPPGGKLGIVGRTGSGKSTLALLMLGLLRPDSGEVRHDGVRLADLDVDHLRSRCGAVLQELTLFNGSVRDNLVLSKPDAGQDDVVHAARLAGLHDDVVALPMGYDTLVGEGGAALSAGQRQRVALARALIHRPRLLILDEATSHLDPETERLVDDALGRLRVTRVVISHRLSAIRNADQILVMDRGRVAQRGRHDDLIGQDGIYRRLFAAPERPSLLPGPVADPGPAVAAGPLR
ncbi:MAG: peptidase domain-containing ABC transporter [Hamadaea sp.]|nr:peptidase domain-containing ABC transporter [Hamadaea sp.]